MFAMPAIFIYDVTTRAKLTRYWKVNGQIDIIERLWTKLKYGIKVMDQICSLFYLFLSEGPSSFLFGVPAKYSCTTSLVSII